MIKIASNEFVRIWNLLSKQCEIKIKEASTLPCTLFTQERGECDLSHFELVAERLNNDEDFHDYMKTRIGCAVRFDISTWGEEIEVRVRKHIINN